MDATVLENLKEITIEILMTVKTLRIRVRARAWVGEGLLGLSCVFFIEA